jgi:hypothetical protein
MIKMNVRLISLVVIAVFTVPALSAFSFTSVSLHRQGTVSDTRSSRTCFSSSLSASSSNAWITANQTPECMALASTILPSSEKDAPRVLGRRLCFQMAGMGAAILFRNQSSFAVTTPKLETIRSQVIEARSQLDPIPQLIKDEKWDSIRAILITPPLSDCWSKTSKLLNSYATAIGNEIPDGDELAALELKEDALDHLRFLDMAVYNNVFNPIRTEGESGATKTLISSYYDDPVNEVSR